MLGGWRGERVEYGVLGGWGAGGGGRTALGAGSMGIRQHGNQTEASSCCIAPCAKYRVHSTMCKATCA